MKKLMIAAAIVCATVAAQAASFTWQSQGFPQTTVMNSITDKSKTLYNQAGGITLYLFDSAMTSQETLLSALRGGTKKIDDYKAATGLAKTQKLASDSKIATTTFDWGEVDGEYNFYMAMIDEKGNLFLSANAPTVTGQLGTSPGVNINNLASTTMNGVFGDDKTFAQGGAGWYSVVPEPTSGLLLLLGVAGLALRRRRA